MEQAHLQKITSELSIKSYQTEAVAKLLAEGATIPFIARYRKEATGSLDEVAITNIRDRIKQLQELDDRRETIIKSLNERDLLTDELQEKILKAETLTTLEDIYLPFRPKRRTRATIAKEKGLEPLAESIFIQEPNNEPEFMAKDYINQGKGVNSIADALSGARDIIAEWISEDQSSRAKMRELFFRKAYFQCSVVKDMETDGLKYEDYFDWQEPVTKAPSHRVLAMRRGAKEGFLKLQVMVPEEQATEILEKLFVKGHSPCSVQVKEALADGYKRLLSPSMETEILAATKHKADEEAIKIFAENLRQLLLAPALGQKNVLAIDPGFRTGCKIICLDRQGRLKHSDVIYPHESKSAVADTEKIQLLCRQYDIEAIAVGNGTAGRETEAFIRSVKLSKDIPVIMVNESGASIYSASEVAREEFPDEDVTVRGAVSIGRRLMDPLAELVKIEPKSIGVGQYQHDVDQSQLRQSLNDVVISCVNSVGVEVNTASKQLLSFVSGLGPQIAANIVIYRNGNGPFKSRNQLRKVPRLGTKAFEQAAGFLRIHSAVNPLDSSAVHPESYHIVDAMAADSGCSVGDLMKDASVRMKIRLQDYVSDSVGLPTLNDIMQELAKPGRDPRKRFEIFSFAEGINKIEDLKIGMKIPGIITNITAFGAFVDIGVHQDGLVHISQMSNKFVKDPTDIVKVHQNVTVKVIDVNLAKKRISLSMKQ